MLLIPYLPLHLRSCAALVPVGALLGSLWCYVMAPPPVDVVPVPAHYTASVFLMLLCCAVELCAETPFVLAELQLWTKTRVRQVYINTSLT